MASWLGDVHVWSLKNHTLISDDNIGCFTYHDKNETESYDQYVEEKTRYTESRDVTWTLKNRRPEKLKDALKEVEDLLLAHKCVLCKWLCRKIVQVVLSNGILISFLVSLHTGDVDRIVIDRSLVGRLSTDSASDVLMTESYLVFAHCEKAVLDFVHFSKKPIGAGRRLDKLSSFEPRVFSVEIAGPTGRRLERKLTSHGGDVILSWWSTAQEEAWPWSPTTGERERANLVLLALHRDRLEMVSFTRSESEPIGINFSRLRPERILSVEQTKTSSGQLQAQLAVYESQHHNKIHRTSVVTIPLKSRLVCYDRNLTEDKVVLGCADGSIIIYDELKSTTHHVVCVLIPHKIRWHPSGTVLIVADVNGQIQVFDQALNALLFDLVSENSSPQKSLNIMSLFKSSISLADLQWNTPLDHVASMLADTNDSIFLLFHRGPVVLVQYYMGVVNHGQLTPTSLVNHYLKHRQVEQAIHLLASFNWNLEGQTCITSITTIVNHLLANPLDAQREAFLERALATFYAPAKALDERCIVEYRDAVSHLARRFFHHLLRFTRFDKAYLLAVDIGARDLFMDIHFIAKDKGEDALAEVARTKAREIEAEFFGSSDMLLSESDEFSDDDEESDDQSSADDFYTQCDDEAAAATQPPARPPRAMTAGRPLPPLPITEVGLTGPARQGAAGQRGDNYTDLSEAGLRQLEVTLASQMVDDYSRQLMMDEAASPASPAPPALLAGNGLAGGDMSGGGLERVQEGDNSPSVVRVIDFGMV